MKAGAKKSSHRKQPNRWRYLPLLFGLAMLGAVIYFAVHYSDARSFAKIVQSARPHWLALAAVIEAATYVSAALVYWCVVRAGGFSLGLGAALRLSLAKLFVDQALPSAGVSGTVVLANGLAQRKVSRPVAAASVVVELASYYAAYVLCLTVALGIAVLRGAANTWVVIVAFVFILFAAGISTAAIRLSGRPKKNTCRRNSTISRRCARGWNTSSTWIVTSRTTRAC